MGFLITGSVISQKGTTHDHFYTRIDHYQLQKSLGHVCTTLGFYESKEKAESINSFFIMVYSLWS